jgi:hypothetical protein
VTAEDVKAFNEDETRKRNERVLEQGFEISRSRGGEWVTITVELADGGSGQISVRSKSHGHLEVR